MDNTSRVAQWRQKMRDEGKEAVTVWLSHDTKLRLEDLAATWRSTTSEMVEQALTQFHPGSPPSISNAADTAQLQALMQDMVRAILPELKEQMLQELRGDMAVADMNGNVTVTVPAQQYEAEQGHSVLTEEGQSAEVCPPFDAAKNVLGKLCKEGHEWGTTGQSLLRLPGKSCRECENEARRQRRAAQRERTAID
jgi:predicted transcriptional regulator